MKTLAIRVCNAHFSGQGHIQRCLIIRRLIKYKVIWFLDEENKAIEKKINNKDIIIYEKSPDLFDNLIFAIKKGKIQVILLDSYYISKNDLYESIKNKAKLITLQDKYEDVNSHITIIPQPITFNTLGKNTFAGANYIPISKSLLNNNNHIKEKNIILISMGAYDKNGLSLKIIDILKGINFFDKKYKIVIILGKYSPNIKKAKDIIKGFKNFTLIVNKKNMNSIYKKSFFAIGAPGVSQAERLASGVPTILISQNKLHNKIIDDWVKLKCAIKSDLNNVKLSKSIYDIYYNNNLRKKIIANGKKIIDGNGANRIANIIIKNV